MAHEDQVLTVAICTYFGSLFVDLLVSIWGLLHHGVSRFPLGVDLISGISVPRREKSLEIYGDGGLTNCVRKLDRQL